MTAFNLKMSHRFQIKRIFRNVFFSLAMSFESSNLDDSYTASTLTSNTKSQNLRENNANI